MNELNHTTLRRLKKQHQAEIVKYAEDYYEASVDNFPESIPFSDDKRDFHNMTTSLWLAFGEAVIESGDDKLQKKFIKEANQAGFFEYSF